MGALAAALRARHAHHAERQLQAQVHYMRDQASHMQQEMKASHPWTNRTHAAERSLFATVDEPQHHGTTVVIELRAGYGPTPGAPHGRFLELARAGQWAIVRPTMVRMAPAIAQGVRTARARAR